MIVIYIVIFIGLALCGMGILFALQSTSEEKIKKLLAEAEENKNLLAQRDQQLKASADKLAASDKLRVQADERAGKVEDEASELKDRVERLEKLNTNEEGKIKELERELSELRKKAAAPRPPEPSPEAMPYRPRTEGPEKPPAPPAQPPGTDASGYSKEP